MATPENTDSHPVLNPTAWDKSKSRANGLWARRLSGRAPFKLDATTRELIRAFGILKSMRLVKFRIWVNFLLKKQLS